MTYHQAIRKVLKKNRIGQLSTDDLFPAEYKRGLEWAVGQRPREAEFHIFKWVLYQATATFSFWVSFFVSASHPITQLFYVLFFPPVQSTSLISLRETTLSIIIPMKEMAVKVLLLLGPSLEPKRRDSDGEISSDGKRGYF